MADVGSLEVKSNELVIKSKQYIEALSHFEPEVISGSFKDQDFERVEEACKKILEICGNVKEKLADILDKTEAVIAEKRTQQNRGRQKEKSDSGVYSTDSVTLQETADLYSCVNTPNSKRISARTSMLSIEEGQTELNPLQFVAHPSDSRDDTNISNV